MNKYIAELLGTFWLVFGGCGSAIFAAGVADVGIGYLGVSLAFGLTVLTAAYAVGHISGGHFNPAVTLGLWAGGRFEAKQIVPYILSQVIGGLIAGAALYLIFSDNAAHTATQGFASNGFGAHSPQGYGMMAALMAEIIATAMFLFVIMGATDRRAPAGFAPIAIGLALTLIHLITIPITNTSVNPARSTGVAFFASGEFQQLAVSQLWLFWVAPIIGGILGATVYRFSLAEKD